MWILVMFDLPTDTKPQRFEVKPQPKLVTKFRCDQISGSEFEVKPQLPPECSMECRQISGSEFCGVGSYISQLSWTGTPERLWRGGYRTRRKRTSASRH